MAKKTDLMGLGVNALLARRQATDPSFVTGVGASQASATQIGGDQYLVCVNASSSSGNGLSLPQVGGDAGCLLGDDFIINNQTTSSVILYVANNSQGSSVGISQGGVLTNGTLGVSVSVHKSMTLYSLTTSTWLGITA